MDTTPIIDAIEGEGCVVTLEHHHADNPVFIGCRCGESCAVWYNIFVQSYAIRHGEGEAMREFSWSELLEMTPIRDWIDAIHGHEGDAYTRADFIVPDYSATSIR